jgi:hypothetical protein
MFIVLATSPLSAPGVITPAASTPVAKDDEKDKSLSPTSDVEVAPKGKNVYLNPYLSIFLMQ